MFGLGFSEILIIATLCILFIPPKAITLDFVQFCKILNFLIINKTHK